jgi:hypothetical protein
MDFTNRTATGENQDAESAGTGINVKRNSSNKKSDSNGKWARIGVLAALAAVVILIIALIVLEASNNNNSTNKTTESNYVRTDKFQAVFLNTGQVYFGNLATLNSSYFVLTNIYYLQTANGGSSSSTPSSNSSVTLVKLGCELHRPYDQMVINRSQVTFWENLESTGQVATAIAKYQQQNPNHTCVDQSSSAGTSSGTAAQGATTNH